LAHSHMILIVHTGRARRANAIVFRRAFSLLVLLAINALVACVCELGGQSGLPQHVLSALVEVVAWADTCGTCGTWDVHADLINVRSESLSFKPLLGGDVHKDVDVARENGEGEVSLSASRR